jgi:hypothetical protein
MMDFAKVVGIDKTLKSWGFDPQKNLKIYLANCMRRMRIRKLKSYRI